MIDWNTDKAAALHAIEARQGPLKLLLKVKDDAYFTEQWIRHHAAIVGIENLVVFDNCSSDPVVLDVFARLSPDLLCIRFQGLHNAVHNVGLFGELYAALGRTCRHFAFLDADEFLLLVRGQQHYATPLLLDYLAEYPGATVFPSTWMWCLPRFANTFAIGSNFDRLKSDFKWGKPVISTALALKGFINHNGQLPAAYYSDVIPTGLFTLHRAHLSPRQRIETNVRKLAARRFCAPTESLDQILSREVVDVKDPNIRLYVSEIKRMRGTPEPDPSVHAALAQGQLQFHDDHSIQFHGEDELFLFHQFLQADEPFLRAALGHV